MSGCCSSIELQCVAEEKVFVRDHGRSQLWTAGEASDPDSSSHRREVRSCSQKVPKCLTRGVAIVCDLTSPKHVASNNCYGRSREAKSWRYLKRMRQTRHGHVDVWHGSIELQAG